MYAKLIRSESDPRRYYPEGNSAVYYMAFELETRVAVYRYVGADEYGNDRLRHVRKAM